MRSLLTSATFLALHARGNYSAVDGHRNHRQVFGDPRYPEWVHPSILVAAGDRSAPVIEKLIETWPPGGVSWSCLPTLLCGATSARKKSPRDSAPDLCV